MIYEGRKEGIGDNVKQYVYVLHENQWNLCELRKRLQ